MLKTRQIACLLRVWVRNNVAYCNNGSQAPHLYSLIITVLPCLPPWRHMQSPVVVRSPSLDQETEVTLWWFTLTRRRSSNHCLSSAKVRAVVSSTNAPYITADFPLKNVISYTSNHIHPYRPTRTEMIQRTAYPARRSYSSTWILQLTVFLAMSIIPPSQNPSYDRRIRK